MLPRVSQVQVTIHLKLLFLIWELSVVSIVSLEGTNPQVWGRYCARILHVCDLFNSVMGWYGNLGGLTRRPWESPNALRDHTLG